MASIGKIARRTFLFGAVAVAGGAAFGFYKLTQTPPNPLNPDDGALNPFVVINADGITLIAPRAEMGQGVHTTLPALVAEELDVALADIKVIHGPAAKAYFNQALLGAAFPVTDYKRKPWHDDTAHFLGNAAKFLDLQVTGGSTSTRDGFVKMREAGAAAREMLKDAAAEQLGVKSAELATENGAVIAPDGTRLPYADLAPAATKLKPRNVTLRDPSEWKTLGKSQPRTDMVGKSTGTATFGIDFRAPGMKFATVKMSPKRSSMRSFDPSDAILMDGVEKIIDLGDGFAVVATNTWLAFQAADAVRVEWDDAPYPADTDAQMAKIAEAFDTSPNSTGRNDGDVETASGDTISAEYSVPFLAHATMEPMTTAAKFTGDALEVWSPNQGPMLIRNWCADAVGLDPEQVTVHTMLMGGAFGRRGEVDFAVLAARVAREMPDTPVLVTWSREEDMRHDFYRPAAIARMSGKVQDGQITALDAQVAAPSPSHQAMARWLGREMGGPDAELTAGVADQPYGIPNYRTRGYLADLDVPVGFWRSVGASYGGFFFDGFIDELAHAAGRDPLEVRLELARREHAPSASVIEKVRDMSGWTGQTPAGIGRGIGFTYSFGTPVAQVIEVRDTDAGIKIDKAWIACDPGTALDPSIIHAQMMGGCIFGLSAATNGQITFTDGEVDQWNFPDYDGLRMHNAPEIEVAILENADGISGVGEPGTPPAAPALANALFDLTGQRARRLPLGLDYSLLI
ncbi:isoquinoline 1-oxidoreductase [Marivivens niveibacter]|uniref:Isoquinoline 1-oxidoreductase n=1 Tax=Marivivens niveibacter TaxID=1930667 RepID=A0A251WXQ1_9RHOB|nr:molybdopterin cofactor-binding domain-containing protein [Marivivens niveibacter]OUD08733.1 isoquinoline 1-oxidoreductase [Marivivens niveibacter]